MLVKPVPQSWDDCGMNWNDPDPLDISYHYALRYAIEERARAWESTQNAVIQPVRQSMTLSHELWNSYINATIYALRGTYNRPLFLNDQTAYTEPLPMLIDAVRANGLPSLSPGSTIREMKDLMICLKDLLDRMTLFRTNVYVYLKNINGIVSNMGGEEYPDWSETERKDFVFDKVTQEYNEEILDPPAPNRITQDSTLPYYYPTVVNVRYDSTYHSSYGRNAYHLSVIMDNRDWIRVRSCARPKLLCLIKPYAVTNDFGTGLQEGVNTIRDYGQIPGNDVLMEPPIIADPLKTIHSQDFQPGNHYLRYHLFPALDYAVEGGFKFY